MKYPLTPHQGLSLDAFSSAAGLHPDLVTRLVALGLLEPDVDAHGTRWFTEQELATVARVRRLRATLPLNYAALGMVLDLLDRIDDLESRLHGDPEP
jgi:hypothetical protein